MFPSQNYSQTIAGYSTHFFGRFTVHGHHFRFTNSSNIFDSSGWVHRAGRREFTSTKSNLFTANSDSFILSFDRLCGSSSNFCGLHHVPLHEDTVRLAAV